MDLRAYTFSHTLLSPRTIMGIQLLEEVYKDSTGSLGKDAAWVLA